MERHSAAFGIGMGFGLGLGMGIRNGIGRSGYSCVQCTVYSENGYKIGTTFQ